MQRPGLIIVALAAACLRQDACQAADRVALVIGNSKYAGDAALKNPSNDADLLETALNELRFEVTKRKDLTLNQMNEALVAFNKALPKGGLGLFFFAGHGVQVNGENFLVPIGADIRAKFQVKTQCLHVETVLDAMDNSESNLKVLVLDCCRNNPFKRGWKRGLNDQHGLAALKETPDGTLIAFSTAAGKAADDGDGKNSPYTKQLADALLSRPAGGLELKEVFFETGKGVKKATGQRPWLSVDGSLDTYYLRPASAQTDLVRDENHPKPLTSNAKTSSAAKDEQGDSEKSNRLLRGGAAIASPNRKLEIYRDEGDALCLQETGQLAIKKTIWKKKLSVPLGPECKALFTEDSAAIIIATSSGMYRFSVRDGSIQWQNKRALKAGEDIDSFGEIIAITWIDKEGLTNVDARDLTTGSRHDFLRE
jgi:hypothetical protein